MLCTQCRRALRHPPAQSTGSVHRLRMGLRLGREDPDHSIHAFVPEWVPHRWRSKVFKPTCWTSDGLLVGTSIMRLFIVALVLGLGTAGVHAQDKRTDIPINPLTQTTKRVGNFPPQFFSGKGGRANSGLATTTPLPGPVEGRDFVFDLRKSAGQPIPPVVMKWIPAGKFQMGSTSRTDPDRNPGEILHDVTLTRGFWLMETEMTQEVYWAVTGTYPSRFNDPKNPVDSVNSVEAEDFCRNIGSQLKQFYNLTGFEFRLPTEAEWEYACRAGTTTAVYVNYRDRDQELEEIAWWGGNAGNAPHHVRQKRPNAWGLYDMIGNVDEWCSDWFGSYPTGSVTDPKGPSSGSSRVHRGGCWNLGSEWARSASRRSDGPGWRNQNLGFRPAFSRAR